MRESAAENWTTIKISEKQLESEIPQFYWSDGVVTTTAFREANTKATLCAKCIPNPAEVKEQLYVLSDGGELFNPQNISSRYIRKNWKFRLTKSKEGFGLYIAFLGFKAENLKYKNTSLLKAERMI